MKNQSQKKILLIRNAFAFDFGGGERFPVLLAEEIQKHGYSPLIVSRSDKLLALAKSKDMKSSKGWWLKWQDFSGIRIFLFPFFLLWQIMLFFHYLALIVRFWPAVVHSQSRDDFIAATFAGKLFGKRVVWTDHADLKYVWQNHKTWYKNPVGKLVYLASKLADCITLVSNSEKSLIEKELGKQLPHKFIVVHNGVPDQKVAPIKRSADDANKIIFVATSRLVKAKGIGELLIAFEMLNKKLPVRLWLLGEGREEGKFKKMATGNKHIEFLGFPDNALSYVAAADVFVHPSYHEGFSISLVEAAMLGKPLVACNVGGNPEIVNDSNGILVPPRNAESLKWALEKLATNQQIRTNYGQAARRLYERDFDFEKIAVRDFLPIYE